MARIVLTSYGSYGDANPFIGLALELRRHGHEPVLALPAVFRAAAEHEALEFHAVRPDVPLHDRDFAARIMDPARGADVVYGEELIPALADTVSDLHDAAAGADAMVTHPASLAGPIVAEELGVPWASTVIAPMSFFSVHDPMVPAPAPWLHALTSRSAWLSRAFLRQTGRITMKWAEPVMRFRESRGLPPGGNPIMEGQHSPHLVLALFSRTLADPQPDWPDNVVVTGAVLYNGAGPDTLSAELEEFLAAGPPPLVFTLGTSAVGAAGSFYDVSVDAARRLSQRAVLLAGPHERNRPAAPGGDVFVADFVRHAALFPRASVVVHQGGAGTLHQALAAGRPMLVVPHAHDQPDYAHRAVRIGVAHSIAPRRYTAARAARELRKLLEEPGFAKRAAEVAAVVRGEGGAVAAAGALDALVRRGGSAR
jgi:rhamnosyltransferase subunit B